MQAVIDIGQNTIPAICNSVSVQKRTPRLHKGKELGDFLLISLMAVTESSELWFAIDQYEERYVAKVTEHHPSRELLDQIRMLKCKNLAELIDYGSEDGLWYEIYPFYRNGWLSGALTEEEIKGKVLPGIINALDHLHKNGIIHNDIKPENIFWEDDKESVVIGDYGCAAFVKTYPAGYTLSYTAPEILMKGVCGRSSDWLSVGLTLAKLTEGSTLIKAKTVEEARRRWEQGVRFSGGSVRFQQLINGMLQIEPERRLGPNAAKKWCGNMGFGGEERIRSIKPMVKETITVSFENPPWIAADINGLLTGIETHWDHAVFLFQQGKLDRFLLQFDKNWGELCKNYRKEANGEAALFKLTLMLTSGRSFVWRGHTYCELLEMEDVWGKGGRWEKDVVTFLQCGLTLFYLEKKGADREQIEYVRRLQNLSRVHAFEACNQLFQALRGNDGLKWGSDTLFNLNDVVSFLMKKIPVLDEEIDKFFQDKRFEAWLAYQGVGDVLEEIRRKCEV